MKLKYSLFALIALNANLLANEVVTLEQMSVTATKVERATKDISESIAVVDEKTIEDKNILNIQDAIQNIPGVIAESSTKSKTYNKRCWIKSQIWCKRNYGYERWSSYD